MRQKTGIRTIIFALLLILGGFSAVVTGTASGAQSGDYTYTLNGGLATITGYTGAGGAITIPSMLPEAPPFFPVVAIGDSAFQSTAGNLVTSVVIPSSVTSIGNYSFTMCTLLTSFTIPSSVTYIGTGTFNMCSSLNQIIVEANNPTYGSLNGVLYNKDFTTVIQYPTAKAGALVLPSTVTSITGQSFYECAALTSITFPNGVTSIGNWAFYGCNGLTSLNIPNCVIGKGAFESCTAVTSVTIASGVTNIGDYAFGSCSSLTSITFLGLVAPTTVVSTWIFNAPLALRGHAYAASNFPAPGGIWNGLTMGTVIPVAPVVPGAPTDLVATPGSNLVTLNWAAPASDGGAPIINYKVYRDYFGSYLLINSPTVLNYLDTDVVNGQTYWYKVSAVNSVGEGLQTAAISSTPAATPGAPQNLQGTPGNSQVSLSWAAPANTGGAPIDYYIVYRDGVDAGHPTSLSTIITGLSNGVSYSFTVAAHNAIGIGTQSSPVTATPATTPGAPTNLVATAGNGQASLSWNAPADNGGAPVTSYKVYRSNTITGIYQLINSPSALTYTDTGLTNGQTYWYKVSAVNSVGEGLQTAAISSTPAATPGAPQNLQGTPENTQISLSWTAPAITGGAPIDYYIVYRDGADVAHPTSLSAIITGLSNGVSYSFTVAAHNAIGIGTQSTPLVLTPATTPGAPTGLVATPGEGQVSLSWTTPADNGGAAVAGYKVYRSNSITGTYVFINSAPATTYTDTGLTNGQTYWYKVSAVNPMGEGALCPAASATPSTDYEYVFINSNTEVQITGYLGLGGSITIPATIEGKPVTSIRYLAFYASNSLTSVTIPNSVTSIGNRAFEECRALTSVTIGNGVTSIGNDSFRLCTSLTYLSLGSSVVSIGDEAFFACPLSSLTIPGSVTSIGSVAFLECTSLTSITIPSSVTGIGPGAFAGCTALLTIEVDAANPHYASIAGVLYDKAETILLQCPSGKTGAFTIPGGVTIVQLGAFYNCTALTSISMGASVTSIMAGAFYNCTALTSVTIGSGITSIYAGVFQNCTALTSINFLGLNAPNTVALDWILGTNPAIRGHAYVASDFPAPGATWNGLIMGAVLDPAPEDFLYTVNGGLATITGYNGTGGAITIPSTLGGYPVVAIGDSAFNDAKGHSISSVIIPEGVTVLGNFSFYACNLLTSIALPDSVASIGNYAFGSCTALSSATFGSGTNNIGNSAFTLCSSLSSIVIPNGVTRISDYAFSQCTSLTSVTMSNNVASIGNNAFSWTALTTITIPNSVTSIERYAFYDCANLASIIIPDGVTSIGANAFSYTPLTTIIIPDSVTSIGDYAFSSTSLTSATISSRITYLGNSTFLGCTALTSLSFMEMTAPGVGTNWIQGTPTTIRGHAYTASNFPAPGATWNGLIMGEVLDPAPEDFFYSVSSGLATITGYNGAGGAITIPSSLGGYPVVAIGDFAFDSVKGHTVTSVIIPSGVTSIGAQAFLSCSLLTSVTLPEGITYIADMAFGYCTSLTSVSIPNSLTVIGNYTFLSSTALASVTIGSGVTTIGGQAFGACSSLSNMTFLGLVAPTSVVQGWIDGTPATLRGHAYAASNFPAPGSTFNGLLMGEPFAVVPGIPLDLSLTPGNGQIVLTWQAPASDGGSIVTHYQLYRSTTSGGTYALIAAPTSPTYTDIGLSNGQTYWYKASAVNAVGEGSNTSIVGTTPFTLPSAPAGFGGTVGDGQVTLHWNAPSDGGSAIGYYVIYQNGTALALHPTGLTVTITGLSNGVPYSFAVVAHNAAGLGALSETLEFIPAPNENKPGEVMSPVAAVVMGTGLAVVGMALAGVGASAAGSSLSNFATWLKDLLAPLDKFLNFCFGFVKGRMTAYAFKLLNKVEPEKGVAVQRQAFMAGFSAHEFVVIVFTSFVLGITYLIAGKMELLDPSNLLIYMVVAGFAIIVHDLTHRYMAWRYNAVTEYQFWWLGTGIMFLTGGLFNVVYGQPARLRIDSSTKLTPRQEAFVYGAGPLMSFLVFLAFALLLPLGGLAWEIGLLGCSMNLLTAVYSMMPFKPMDGRIVMKWNLWAWALTFPTLLALYFVLTIYVF